jgi:NADPH:quinone reductase-like Zn-dependent oxidoreductase
MKAVRFHEFGGPAVLNYEEADQPQPQDGQVLIKVAGTSFNPVDANIRAGYLREVFPINLPHVPGLDVSGTVAEVGPGVSNVAIGDAVFGFLPMTQDGAAAEYVVAPAEVLAPAPASIPLADAAAIPAAALTAYQALFEHAKLQAGQRILINGAGGGVGGSAVQLAKGAGAYVIATASARSRDAIRSYGADEIVDYTSTELTAAVGEPVDVVLNLVRASEPEMASLVSLVRNGGILVSTASPANEDPERQVRTVGMYVRSDAADLASIAAKLDAGELVADVSQRVSLADLGQVHEQAEAGKIRGKIVVTPALDLAS